MGTNFEPYIVSNFLVTLNDSIVTVMMLEGAPLYFPPKLKM